MTKRQIETYSDLQSEVDEFLNEVRGIFHDAHERKGYDAIELPPYLRHHHALGEIALKLQEYIKTSNTRLLVKIAAWAAIAYINYHRSKRDMGMPPEDKAKSYRIARPKEKE